MTKYVLVLATFCAVLWALLIHYQQRFSQYEWYKPFKRQLMVLVNEFCRVSYSLQTVKTLISKTENDLKIANLAPSRRKVFQENLNRLRKKENELENKYMDLSDEINNLFVEHLDEIQAVSNALNPQILELQDLYRIYIINRIKRRENEL